MVSRSRTVNPLHGGLVMSGIFMYASPNLDILGVKFDRRLALEDYVRGIICRVSQRIGILRLLKRVCVERPLCHFVATVRCGGLQLNVKSASQAPGYSVARLCHDQSLLLLCHRRHVAALCMSYKVNSNSNHCVFSELLSASVRVRHKGVRLVLIH